MIHVVLTLALTFFSIFGFQSSTQAGPIIVGNGSGLSEFNFLLVQRELQIWTKTCRSLPTCEPKLHVEEWIRLEDAETWLKNSQFLFVAEQDLPGKTYEVQLLQNTVRFNKAALWVKMPLGELRGLNLSEATHMLFEILKTEFAFSNAIDDVQKEIISLLDAQASQYDVVLSNHYRLTVTNMGNGLSSLALIRDHEDVTQIEFFDFANEVQCLSEESPQPASHVRLNDLTYAHFTGPFLPNPDINMNFYGALTYDCQSAAGMWHESARLRLILKIREIDSGLPSQRYVLEPSRSRIRFDSVTRI
ncbi:MAG: hypothetical protein IPJ84_10135 [Bdellovibrionales bacterium]|nr:hypothetical protein [Bdellovibrionales bacterium]